MSQNTSLRPLLEQFGPISLEDSKAAALMKRLDFKFIFHESMIPDIFEKLSDSYYIFTIDGEQLFHYDNTYFDTPSLKFFYDHMNGRANRLKIRVRSYVESDLHFLEMKHKNNKGETDKRRMRVDQHKQALAETELKFLSKKADQPEILHATLHNNFQRITFVHKAFSERITFDFNIRFTHEDKCFDLPGLVVAESKCESGFKSPFQQVMHQLKIKPSSFSKYLMGVQYTRDNVKRNAVKPLLRTIRKITSHDSLVS